MCRLEVFGDLYRGCGHFVNNYYSGEKDDCGKPNCKMSDNHEHRGREDTCPCVEPSEDNRKIMNMFHKNCEACAYAKSSSR